MNLQLSSAAMPFLFLGLSSCAQDPTLDGKSFVIYWYDANHPEEQVQDTLVFQDGQLDCLHTHTWGFSAGAYTCTKEGDSFPFQSTLASPSEGTIQWTGKVDGDKVSGQFFWPKEDMTFKFTGIIQG
jgi:hypothetical protein